MAGLPQDFVNSLSIATFTGTTFAITLITSVVRRLTGTSTPLIPAAFALIICLGFAFDRGFPHDFVGWLVIVVNACMLFCAAVGANETTTSLAHPKPAGLGAQHAAKPRRWFATFF